MKKRNMPKISAVILAVLICVFAGILIGKLKENYDPEIFSENYISVDEVKQELIFTVYSQEEWDEWFEGGKKDYLTGAVLDELLKRLEFRNRLIFRKKEKMLPFRVQNGTRYMRRSLRFLIWNKA